GAVLLSLNHLGPLQELRPLHLAIGRPGRRRQRHRLPLNAAPARRADVSHWYAGARALLLWAKQFGFALDHNIRRRSRRLAENATNAPMAAKSPVAAVDMAVTQSVQLGSDIRSPLEGLPGDWGCGRRSGSFASDL